MQTIYYMSSVLKKKSRENSKTLFEMAQEIDALHHQRHKNKKQI